MAFPNGKNILGIHHRIVAALLSADVPCVALLLLVRKAAILRVTLEAYSPCTSKKIEVGAICVVIVNIEYAGRKT